MAQASKTCRKYEKGKEAKKEKKTQTTLFEIGRKKKKHRLQAEKCHSNSLATKPRYTPRSACEFHPLRRTQLPSSTRKRSLPNGKWPSTAATKYTPKGAS